MLDAIENLHRLDKDFLRELVARHKSGLDILAGSEQFDRPNAQDAGAIEELLRVLGAPYDYIVIDAGNMINSAAVAALYAADTIFLVTNPDVPSIRNAQRLVDRVRQLGAGSERVKMTQPPDSRPAGSDPRLKMTVSPLPVGRRAAASPPPACPVEPRRRARPPGSNRRTLALVVDHRLADGNREAVRGGNQLDDVAAETPEQCLEIRRLVALPRLGHPHEGYGRGLAARKRRRLPPATASTSALE